MPNEPALLSSVRTGLAVQEALRTNKESMMTRFLAVVLSVCLLGIAGFPGQTCASRALVLDAREQSIVGIAAFAAMGDTDRLKKALGEGLNSG